MNDANKTKILDQLVNMVELPPSAYEKAIARYEDLGDWLGRKDSALESHAPHVFPQGSFRLGTAVRPLNEKEEYDLDLGCKLTVGFSKDRSSQKELKRLVGGELEAYREARGISEGVKEKKRCWRLEYQDTLTFHMDIVPCIPRSQGEIKNFSEGLRSSLLEGLRDKVSATAVDITDNTKPNYSTVSPDWNISNQEGYALWFDERANQNKLRRDFREFAQVDPIPLYRRKTVLQRTVQLLKRHRNAWKGCDESLKPISVILTTLASHSYAGEESLVDTLSNILDKMDTFIQPASPRIANPVAPREDFADKWRTDQRLEIAFQDWLKQVRKDFSLLLDNADESLLSPLIEKSFKLSLSAERLEEVLGRKLTVPTKEPIKVDSGNSPKPWRSSI
jgi:hypothetical protein